MGTEQPRIVVMGVSGSGKSTIGRALAHELGVVYADGDDLHPPGNIEKMAAGIPLDDADRRPWLAAVGEWLAGRGERGGVISCSALKVEYRDRLRAAAPNVYFLALRVPRAELIHRMTTRTGHFMHRRLLDSQLRTLQPLTGKEYGSTVEATGDADAVVRDALAALDSGTGPQSR